MKYTINCANIHSPEDFHQSLAETLSFPEWYGNNLDALYDLLTEIPIETHLILKNWYTLPSSFQRFKLVMDDAEKVNIHFYVNYR